MGKNLPTGQQRSRAACARICDRTDKRPGVAADVRRLSREGAVGTVRRKGQGIRSARKARRNRKGLVSRSLLSIASALMSWLPQHKPPLVSSEPVFWSRLLPEGDSSCTRVAPDVTKYTAQSESTQKIRKHEDRQMPPRHPTQSLQLKYMPTYNISGAILPQGKSS